MKQLNLNIEQLNVFLKGWANDLSDNFEQNNSFLYGLNGRLYSENGTLNYTSIKGTKTVFTNPAIMKYLGWYAFKDELILFVKYNSAFAENSDTIIVTSVHSPDVIITTDYLTSPDIIIGSSLANAAYSESVTENILHDTAPVNPLDKTNYSLGNTNPVLNLKNIILYQIK